MTPRLMSVAMVAIAVGSCSRSGTPRATTAAAGPVRSGDNIRFEASSPQLERIRVVPVTPATLAVDEFDLPGKVEAMPARLGSSRRRCRVSPTGARHPAIMSVADKRS